MQTKEAIRTRRSCRSFNSAKAVPRHLIEELLDAGRLAATARNVQPWEFVVVTGRPILKELGGIIENGRFIADSFCCIVTFCQDTKYYLEDGCAASENILIMAQDLGVSACWVAGDKKEYSQQVREMLGVPANYKLVSLIPVGYSDSLVVNPPKRNLKEIVHWEKWK